MSVDVLFSSSPWIDGTVCLAPAILKSVVQKQGYTAKAIDLAAYVYQYAKQHPQGDKIQIFCKQQHIDFDVFADEIIADLIENCVREILKHNPKILGLSLLSQESQFFAMWLCYHLKHIAPEIKIVIGGSGVKNFIAGSDIFYADELRNMKIIDDYIIGDGEHAVIEYLKGNLNYTGINKATWAQIDDLEQFPFPDFDDYNFNWYGKKSIPLCDSRGCVRKCEFCDIIEHWKKYKYRSGQHVFAEILHQIKKHGIKHFSFYNSLTNGNMREFEVILDCICDYNFGKPKHQQISWDGYFIIRNQKMHPESIWQKLGKSNAHLFLGVESVVEHVRIGLGKNFTNNDIDYHLEMSKKYNIDISILLIVGYPTETLEDFQFTKQWFVDRTQYAQTINSVVCTLCAILPGTRLEKNLIDYGINKDQNQIPINWVDNNKNMTESDRKKHLITLTQLLQHHGFACAVDDASVSLIV